MIFIDTNYFLRFLLSDNLKQHKIAERLFEEAALDKKNVFTSNLVFFELSWILSSFYEKNKREIIVVLKDILKMEFVNLDSKELLETAISVYEDSGLNLVDCFNLVYALDHNADEFKTFDKKLSSKFKEITKS